MAMHHNFFYEDQKLSESHPDFNKGVQDLVLDLRFGLLLDYQYNAHWAISTGIVGAGVGFGSSFGSVSSYGVAGYKQIPLVVTYHGKEFEWLRYKQKNLIYGQFVYSLGTNLNISTGNRLNNMLVHYSSPYYLFKETGDSYYRNHNIGLQANLGIQFRRSDGHNNLRIDIIYHKGLLKQIKYGVDYWNTSMPSVRHAVVSGRGSWLGLRLSYPILLKSWNKT